MKTDGRHHDIMNQTQDHCVFFFHQRGRTTLPTLQRNPPSGGSGRRWGGWSSFSSSPPPRGPSFTNITSADHIALAIVPCGIFFPGTLQKKKKKCVCGLSLSPALFLLSAFPTITSTPCRICLVTKLPLASTREGRPAGDLS